VHKQVIADAGHFTGVVLSAEEDGDIKARIRKTKIQLSEDE
jgi:hypothetical protein